MSKVRSLEAKLRIDEDEDEDEEDGGATASRGLERHLRARGSGR
jgi:hypothetical protein